MLRSSNRAMQAQRSVTLADVDVQIGQRLVVCRAACNQCRSDSDGQAKKGNEIIVADGQGLCLATKLGYSAVDESLENRTFDAKLGARALDAKLGAEASVDQRVALGFDGEIFRQNR
jgi:hypothetical protein